MVLPLPFLRWGFFYFAYSKIVVYLGFNVLMFYPCRFYGGVFYFKKSCIFGKTNNMENKSTEQKPADANTKTMETKKGFVNLHIDLETKQIFCSQKPYETKEEAEKGIFIGGTIFKLGIFEIEYPVANGI